MIRVLDYDPAWATRFGELEREYRRALDRAGVPFVAIEHVGSTAVPGLAAKPIIDCDIVVGTGQVEAASGVLTALGFLAEGELGIPQRWAFAEPPRFAPTNTYVIVAGSLALRNHLAVRDALRADPVLRDEYAAVKKAVARDAADLAEYGRGKNAVVQRILAAAGLGDEDLASIDAAQVPSPDEVPRRPRPH